MREDSELLELVRKYALQNAVRHGGEAQIGPVIGKILGEKAEYRKRVKELSSIVNQVVSEVNAASADEQDRIVRENWPETYLKEKVEEKRLPPLPNVEKYEVVVTRYAPNPDCVLHLGSARAIVLSHAYARMYEGKFLLRFEDTDPKLKRPLLEFYELIRKDLDWLECKPDEEFIQSDRIPIYYEHAEKLIEKDAAYVCTCKPESFRERVLNQKPCECRSISVEEQIERWKKMLEGGYKEGEAVVRVKTDLDHPNPAVRDWPALRILDTQRFPHPRVGSKYQVWPLYNLSAGIDDHLMQVTHIIRGKEHLTNEVRQRYMFKHFGWKYPEAIHYGRLRIAGTSLSKSKIVQGVRQGLYASWDDPRLATFLALQKRGITPESIKKMIVDVGPKTSDVALSWENLYAYNRKVLDSRTNRYFFVQNPIELTVSDVPKRFDVKLRFHPDHPERGFREYEIDPRGGNGVVILWVSSRDIGVSDIGKVLRLMELFNVKIEKANVYSAEAQFVSEAYEDARRLKAQLIHWVHTGNDVRCRIVMPDTSIVEGVAEGACERLKPDDVVQFERFGFVRIDQANEGLTAYFGHK